MKIIVVGANGTIGQAVVKALETRHEVVKVGRNRGDFTVDMTSPESITAFYERVGAFDALAVVAGDVHFGPLNSLNPKDLQVGLQSKLMGQVNLVLQGLEHISDGGSFTLISGVLSNDPIAYGTAATMTNAAVEGFVRGAAIEMPRGIRINAVSPTIVEESLDSYGPYFLGWDPVPAAKAALGFVRSIEGLATGRVFSITGVV